MAPAPPDPLTLTSAADIFSGGHTLPQIRAIHDSLHVSIEEKAGRLRTQVGSSYRELLGTADTIVQMRGDNERVQELLGGMGSRCGRAVVGSKASGLADFVRRGTINNHNSQTTTSKKDLERAARIKLLDACSLVVGRLLRSGGNPTGGSSDPESGDKGDRLILAAKVLVLSRLVSKTLDEGDDSGREVEASKKALGSLRRRLLRQVEKVLGVVTQDDDRDRVVKALCAYSLATSSGAKDALRHLLHVRAEAMATALDSEQDGVAAVTSRVGKDKEDVMLGLSLYTRSLLDVQAIAPSRLPQALAQLKSRPLLGDPALKQLYGLRLDVYERWCGDEVGYFTPFVRHDDLDGPLAREMLSSWAKRGGEVFLRGLGQALSRMSEFKAIMDLRSSVLRLWIRDGGRARGLDPTTMQDGLRSVINARMLAVLQSKVDRLHLVGSEVKSTLETWKDDDGLADQSRSLWDGVGGGADGYEEALSRGGAAALLDDVVTRLYGRSDAVGRAVTCYSTWFRITDDVTEVVTSLTRQRWDNDVDEVEDEDTIEARQQALSRDDPAELQKTLDRSLDTAFADLERQLRDLWAARAGSGPIAVYFVRVLRDIRAELPDRPATASFGLSMVPELHETIAAAVCEEPLDDFAAAVLEGRTVIGRTLWEEPASGDDGNPALPTQTSPGLFGFLRDMTAAMGDAGTDLWTPGAVGAVKKLLDAKLADAWKAELGKLEDEDEADEEDKDEKDREQLRIQWLFDATYLECCLAREAEIKVVIGKLREAVSLDEAAQSRITKAAEAFWQRTSLLFGLLA